MARKKPRSNTQTTTAGQDTAVKIFFGTLTLAVGIGLLSVRYVTLRDTRAARNWVATPCVIERAQTMRDDEGGSYLDIVYRYEFAGTEHHSDRLDFMPGSMGDDEAHYRQQLGPNPQGTKTICFVDPHDPSVAVLDRQRGAENTKNLLLLASPFLFMGAAFYFAVAVKYVNARLDAQQVPTNRDGTPTLPEPSRKLGMVSTTAFLLAGSPMNHAAWAFFAGFAFVFQILDGPQAVRDLWPSESVRLPGTITYVGAIPERELRQQVFEYQFTFELAGVSHTGSSKTPGRHYEVGDRADVLVNPAKPQAAYIVRTRRYAAPVWVMVIPGCVLALLALGIVGNYVFRFRSLSLLRHGEVALAQCVDERMPENSTDPTHLAVHTFQVKQRIYKVDQRSHVSRTTVNIPVLYAPSRPERNIALNSRQISMMSGVGAWYGLIIGVGVPGICLAITAWLWF